MNAALKRSAIAIFALSAVVALGADIDITPLPDSSLWAALVTFISGLKNSTAIGIGAAVVELGVVAFRTSIGSKLTGIYTLAVLYGLSAVAFLLHGLATGTPVLQILTNAVFTGALVNSANEVIKHLFPAKTGA